MSPPTIGAVALAVLGAVGFAVVQGYGRAAAARERARVFDDVVAVVEDPVVVPRAYGYPELRCRVRGHPARLRVHVDALVIRKLPVLWLEVVVHRRVPVAGTISVLLRPHGAEYFSPHAGLGHELPRPGTFPGTSRVAASTPDAAPALDLLAPLAGYLAEPETKEVGVGPRGLRTVRLLASADQGAYRVSRRAAFTGARVAAPEVLRSVEVLDGLPDRAPKEATT